MKKETTQDNKELFTAGEWYVVENFPTEDRHDFQIACNCKRGSRQIAQILKRNYSLENDLPTLAESRANAYVMSQAPAMYKALKDLLNSMAGYRREVADPLAEEIADDMRTIESILNKANPKP